MYRPVLVTLTDHVEEIVDFSYGTGDNEGQPPAADPHEQTHVELLHLSTTSGLAKKNTRTTSRRKVRGILSFGDFAIQLTWAASLGVMGHVNGV